MSTRVAGCIGMVIVAFVGSLGLSPSARASNFGVELNGVYRVFSDGEWAKKNEVFFDQASVIETWTVTTDCVSPIECSGEVKSDLGWTGTARLGYFWYVEHTIPKWIPCSDGTFADGVQQFIIWGVNPDTGERMIKDFTHFAARNVTKGPSGACGVSNPVVIELPARIDKIS
ncbi:hypothetical protein [Mycolicibacterium pyrenivorans]|uniref:hypothetical protein n=1 Tax=Mycolicibacterium pyrenivorans TaxID=187102 RepID=UPI0021F291D8|nr:hypothetical protein [Mycolicibacterium pyrenivorans]